MLQAWRGGAKDGSALQARLGGGRADGLPSRRAGERSNGSTSEPADGRTGGRTNSRQTSARIGGWANGRASERANERAGERADERAGERANGPTSEPEDGRTGEQADGEQAGGRANGRLGWRMAGDGHVPRARLGSMARRGVGASNSWAIGRLGGRRSSRVAASSSGKSAGCVRAEKRKRRLNCKHKLANKNKSQNKRSG